MSPKRDPDQHEKFGESLSIGHNLQGKEITSILLSFIPPPSLGSDSSILIHHTTGITLGILTTLEAFLTLSYPT